MGSGQLDLAWMGPWGYIIANNSTGCTALTTVKYDDKPIYHAIVVGRPTLNVTRFPQGTQGLSMSFAAIGSTSGWLIPTWYAKEVWKIDPKSCWKYSEGATHAANEVAVQAGQVDMATDFDRNRNAMIESGRLKADGTRVLWTSDPLPNDAIAVAKGTPKEFIERVQKILTSISVEQAKSLLPNRYTGFVAWPSSAACISRISPSSLPTAWWAWSTGASCSTWPGPISTKPPWSMFTARLPARPRRQTAGKPLWPRPRR